MTCWTCPKCNEENGELNGWCEYCKVLRDEKVYNPDRYYIREIRIRHIIVNAEAERSETMTPQEELFSKLFNHEKLLVKDMDTLTLRAHREDLAKIAFEARARLTAVDDEETGRKKLSEGNKPTGFARNINDDSTASAAINTIKKRVSKADKIRAGLLKLGIDSTTTDQIMSAKNLLTQIQNKAQNTTKPENVSSEPVKAFINPFAKKD